MDQSVYRPLHSPRCAVACSTCNLREICLPVGLTQEELQYIDHRLVAGRRKVARGAKLFQEGDRFTTIYAIWTGFFKTCVSSRAGREQVTGFQMGGELLGLDGLDSMQYQVDAVALEDSQVCAIPYEEFRELAHQIHALQEQFDRIMSHEIVRNHGVMLLLGSMHAEQRLAAFLLNLSHRLSARGFSSSEIVLRMSREEIGSLLGLKLETVSRTFSKFQVNGLLAVQHRHIQIVDPQGLRQLLDGPSAERR